MRILLKSDDYNIYDTDQLTNYCIKLNLKQKINKIGRASCRERV